MDTVESLRAEIVRLTQEHAETLVQLQAEHERCQQVLERALDDECNYADEQAEKLVACLVEQDQLRLETSRASMMLDDYLCGRLVIRLPRWLFFLIRKGSGAFSQEKRS
jgi:hypothetical protein